VPGTTAPAASAAPGATASSATPARSATTTTPARSAGPGTTATRPPGATAVIFGVVQASPACPVDRVYHACGPRPLGHVEVQARSPMGGVMASAPTEADGQYSLWLGPGSYLLVVVITQVFPRCPHVLVSVGSGAAIRANISCDTGIRLRHLGPPATNPA
jgi:hypothetical protein